MILNKNNYFARYYNWIYLAYPKDVCSFFWGSVLAILLAPCLLPGKGLARLSEDYSLERSIVGQVASGLLVYLMIALITALGNGVLDGFGYIFIYWWSVLLGGFTLGILSIATIALIVWGGFTLFKATGKVIPETHVWDNTKDFVGAIKGKYCTKINWK